MAAPRPKAGNEARRAEPAAERRRVRTLVLQRLRGTAPLSALPGTAELAREYDTSARTVRLVLEALQEEGRLVRVRHVGTFVAGRATRQRGLSGASAASRLAAKVTEEIECGALRNGDFVPAVKVMALRFGVSASTVSGAYHILQETGLITKVGKRFQVGRFRDLMRNERIAARRCLIFRLAGEPPQTLLEDPALAPSLKKLERDLVANGISLLYVSRADVERLLLPQALASEFPTSIVAVSGPWEHERSQRLLTSLARAVKARRRRLLLIGHFQRPPLAGVPSLSVNNLNTAIMRAAADHIATSRRRVTVFTERDPPYSCPPPSYFKVLGELRRRGDRRPFELVVLAEDAEESESHPDLEWVGQEGILKKYPELTRRILHQTVTLTSHFERAAVSRTERAIWLVDRAWRAAQALGYCRAAGIKVPEEVSILSFEERTEDVSLGISTCACDWDTAGHQMAHALVGDRRVARTNRGFLKVAAYVAHRATTAST